MRCSPTSVCSPPGTPPKAILAGQVPLPWQHGAEGVEERTAKLRSLGRLILPCLARDPSQWPRAEAVLRSWNSLFNDMQTHGMFNPSQQFTTCSQLSRSTGLSVF